MLVQRYQSYGNTNDYCKKTPECNGKQACSKGLQHPLKEGQQLIKRVQKRSQNNNKSKSFGPNGQNSNNANGLA